MRYRGLGVQGWAVGPGKAPVARVEILLDGREVGRARLGLPGPPQAERLAQPDALVCGFEHRIDRAELPPPGHRVSIAALVLDTQGRRHSLPPVSIELGEPERPFDDVDGRAAELRRRTGELLRPAPSAARPGTKILVSARSLRIGGAQLYLLELLSRLVRDEGFSCVLLSAADGPLRARFEESGVPVHVTSGYGTESAEAYEGKLAELAAWAAPQRFDAILANGLDSFPGIDLAGRLGIPGVFSIHESLEVSRWTVDYRTSDSRYARERLVGALAGAAATIFPAEATRRQYTACGDPERYLTLPFGIEFGPIAEYRERFDRDRARRRFGIPREARLVLCLGSFERRKAQVSLAMAFSTVADAHRTAVLALVGDPRGQADPGSRQYAYADGLERAVARSRAAARIHIVPVVSDPYQWLGAADVLVSCSDREALPRSVVEAMAFDAPVLATAIFGLPELIEDGRTGYLCEPRDVDALARGLDRALSAPPEELAALGAAAHTRARERHDPSRYSKELSRLLSAVAEDAGSDPRRVLGRQDRLAKNTPPQPSGS